MNHDWLFQVLIAATYSWAGTAGLTALKIALVAATLGLARVAMGRGRGLTADLAVVLVLWGALPLTGTFRAQLLTWLYIALLAVLLNPGARRRTMGVPLLFLVWANSHVGWVLGLGLLGVWAIGELRTFDRARVLRAIVLVGASAASTLVNPYGWRLWAFTLRVSHISRDISEWQPLWTSPVVNWIPWTVCVAFVLVAVWRRRIALEQLVFLAALGYVSMRVLKFTPFFVECAMLSAAGTLAATTRADSARPLLVGVVILNGAAAGVFAVAAAFAVLPGATCLRMADWRPDAAAAHALIAAKPEGRIVPFFDWGEYVIWHLGPALKVSFDPRYDLLYSEATIAEQRAVAAGSPDGRAFLSRARPEYLWFPQRSAPLKKLLAEMGYRFDVDTKESFVAVRGDRPVLPVVEDRDSRRCFPEP